MTKQRIACQILTLSGQADDCFRKFTLCYSIIYRSLVRASVCECLIVGIIVSTFFVAFGSKDRKG